MMIITESIIYTESTKQYVMMKLLGNKASNLTLDLIIGDETMIMSD